jgi:hypothetical protein
MQTGVGIAQNPVPQAAAPEVTTVAGTLEPGTYYVAAAWVNGNGEEGNCSLAQTVTTAAGVTFGASMANAPAGVRQWNFYAGLTADSMTLQNAHPLRADEIWIQGTAVANHGPEPGGGQRPSFVRALPRILQRG